MYHNHRNPLPQAMGTAFLIASFLRRSREGGDATSNQDNGITEANRVQAKYIGYLVKRREQTDQMSFPGGDSV